MNVTFQRENDKSFVLIKDEGFMDDFTINMLCENQLTGFVQAECRTFNGEKMFYYNISDCISLADFAKGKNVDTGLIKNILQSILFAIKQIHPYFLHPDGICLDTNYIFIKENQILFCYYPQEHTIEENLKTLAQDMLPMVDNSDETAVVVIYQFYMLSTQANLSAQTVLSKVLFGQENGMKEESNLFSENKDANLPQEEPVSMDLHSPSFATSDLMDSSKESKQEGLSAYIWYILLMFVSLIYGLFTVWHLDITIYDFLMRREGILSIAFFIFGLCGLLLDRFFLKKFRNTKS